MLGAAGGVAIPYLYPSLPDPAIADRDGLFRWLVVRDLGQESAETRRVLAHRLEEECSTGIDWEAAGQGLDEPQRRRVWNNIVLLLQPWFVQKRDYYFELDQNDRPAYLDRLLDTFEIWQGVDALCPDETEDDGSSGEKRELLSVLSTHVQQWKEASPREERQRTDRFLWAIQSRWVLRSLKKMDAPDD